MKRNCAEVGNFFFQMQFLIILLNLLSIISRLSYFFYYQESAKARWKMADLNRALMVFLERFENYRKKLK